MSEIKVGMRLRSTYQYCPVKEIVPEGFKFTHPKQTIKIGMTEFATTEGGEAMYEEINA